MKTIGSLFLFMLISCTEENPIEKESSLNDQEILQRELKNMPFKEKLLITDNEVNFVKEKLKVKNNKK